MSKSGSKLFSIIIPAYNTEDFIEECILSVLKQAECGCEYEVIVIDDCSTDSTLEIVKGITSNNLLILKAEMNSGPGAARNKGIEVASGEWVLFLDSDDILHPEALLPYPVKKIHLF